MWSRLWGYGKAEQSQQPSADELIKQHVHLSDGLLATALAYNIELQPVEFGIKKIAALLNEDEPDWLEVEMMFLPVVELIKKLQLRAFNDEPFDTDKILSATEQKPNSRLNVILYTMNDLLSRRKKNERDRAQFIESLTNLKNLLGELMGQLIEQKKQQIAESYYGDTLEEEGSRCSIS